MLPAALCRRASAFDFRPSFPSVIGSLANLLDIPGFADLGVFLLASKIMSNIRTNIDRLKTHSLASQRLAFCPKTMWILGHHLPIGRSVM